MANLRAPPLFGTNPVSFLPANFGADTTIHFSSRERSLSPDLHRTLHLTYFFPLKKLNLNLKMKIKFSSKIYYSLES